MAGDGQEMDLMIEQRLPDIILSARVRSSDRKDGYESGADIYLTKPTNPIELVSVIQNLYGRLKPDPSRAPWQLDSVKNAVITPDGVQVRNAGLETLLLKELILHGRFATHDDLIDHVGNPDKDEQANKLRIEVLISRLRKKLSPHIEPALFINVLSGKGYQLKIAMEVKNLAPSKNIR